MGIHGLWQLVEPVKRPILLETLAGRRLAIDASIWMYQFQMAMRDKKTGDPLQGSHIMGTFRRIVKLLYYGIKPVFVFDGDAPMLKKRTIAERKRRKAGATKDLAKTAQQFLSARLRALAATNALEKEKRKNKGKEKQRAVDDEEGDLIDENAVYLEDLDPDASPPRRATLPAPVTSPKKYVPKDQYALPSLEGTLESRAKPSDPRLATEAELRDFIDEMRPEDFDIDSDFFGNLPTEVKYEIIGDLRVKSRQVNHRRVDAMRLAATPLDFSQAQIKNLMERNTLTQKLFSVTDALGQSSIAIPTRVAGERNREYVLVKQDVEKGGGWVLGVRDPARINNEPVVIDDSSDESSVGATESDAFEEVEVLKAKPRSPSPDVETRRALAIEAIRARYAPEQAVPVPDPYLDRDGPSPTSGGTSLFAGPVLDEDEMMMDLDLQAAIMASVDSAAAHEGERSVAWLNEALFGAGPPPPAEVVPAVEQGYESEESLEYVDGIIDDDDEPPLPVPTRLARLPDATLSESDDSDDFEEVQVSAPHAADKSISISVPRPLPARPPTPVRQPTPAYRASSASVAPPSNTLELSSDMEPEPESAPQQSGNKMSIMDSILPSDDSDSDGDLEIIEPTPRVLSPPKPRLEQVLPAAPAPEPVPAPIAFEISPSLDKRELPVFQRRKRERSPPVVVPPIVQHQLQRSPTPLAVQQHPTPELASCQRSSTPPPVTVRRDATPPPPQVERQPSPAPIAQPQRTASTEMEGLKAPEPVEDAPEGGGDDDDEEFFEWERSPTPPPRRDPTSRALFEPPDAFDEEPDFEDEDAEELLNLEREGDNYASMLSQLKNRKLDDMVREAETEVSRLHTQKNADQRNADGVTRQMALDIKDLLALFGIPYVDAPQEAEAECAALLQQHLVDGIVTDDSDVFLFGGARVYRNMFNNNQTVECYLLSDLERELGLDRAKLVDLAYLLGGDYAEGVPGVGPVSARELLEDFRGANPLERFKDWWLKVQSGQDTPEDTSTPWRRKFKKGHKNLVLDTKWPNPIIARAYYHPVVNEDDTAFSWAGPDLDGLRSYLYNTLSWSTAKTDETMLPMIKRQNQRKDGTLKIQQTLMDHFDISAGNGPLAPREKRVGYGSARLQNVVQTWRKNQKAALTGATEADLEDDDEVLLPPMKASPRKRKKSTSAPTPARDGSPSASASNSNSTPGPDAAAGTGAQPKKKSSAKSKAPAKAKAPTRALPKTTAASRRRVAKERRDARAVERGGVYSSENEAFVAPTRAKRARASKKPLPRVEDEVPSEGDEELRRPSAAMLRKRQRQAASDEE